MGRGVRGIGGHPVFLAAMGVFPAIRVCPPDDDQVGKLTEEITRSENLLRVCEYAGFFHLRVPRCSHKNGVEAIELLKDGACESSNIRSQARRQEDKGYLRIILSPGAGASLPGMPFDMLMTALPARPLVEISSAALRRDSRYFSQITDPSAFQPPFGLGLRISHFLSRITAVALCAIPKSFSTIFAVTQVPWRNPCVWNWSP